MNRLPIFYADEYIYTKNYKIIGIELYLLKNNNNKAYKT